MTNERIAEIKRRAKQDYVAMKAGWPSHLCTYSKKEEFELWEMEMDRLKTNDLKMWRAMTDFAKIKPLV